MDTHLASRPAGPTRHAILLRAARSSLLVVTSIACLLASSLHLGLTIDLGGLRLAEPTLLAAGIVEGAIGLALAASGVALATGWRAAHRAIVAAYAFGVVGFLIGISFVVRDPDIQTPFNVGVHAAILPLLVLGSVLELASRRSGATTSRDG